MQCLSLSFSYFHSSFINQSTIKEYLFPLFLFIIEICFYTLVDEQFLHTIFMFLAYDIHWICFESNWHTAPSFIVFPFPSVHTRMKGTWHQRAIYLLQKPIKKRIANQSSRKLKFVEYCWYIAQLSIFYWIYSAHLSIILNM